MNWHPILSPWLDPHFYRVQYFSTFWDWPWIYRYITSYESTNNAYVVVALVQSVFHCICLIIRYLLICFWSLGTSSNYWLELKLIKSIFNLVETRFKEGSNIPFSRVLIEVYVKGCWLHTASTTSKGCLHCRSRWLVPFSSVKHHISSRNSFKSLYFHPSWETIEDFRVQYWTLVSTGSNILALFGSDPEIWPLLFMSNSHSVTHRCELATQSISFDRSHWDLSSDVCLSYLAHLGRGDKTFGRILNIQPRRNTF